MSMYMTDTFCSFMRYLIFKSCFLLSEYSRIGLLSVQNDVLVVQFKVLASTSRSEVIGWDPIVPGDVIQLTDPLIKVKGHI